MLMECSRCGRTQAFGVDERPKPWCPNCGSDLRPAASSIPAKPAVALSAASALPAAAQAAVIAVREVPRQNDVPVAAGSMPPSQGATAPDSRPVLVCGANPFWQAVFGVCALVCFGILGIAASQYFNPSAPRRPSGGVMLGLAALFGGGGLACAYGGLRLVGLKYRLFPDRLVVTQAGETAAYGWDQIRAVVHVVHRGWQKYRIETRKGQVLNLTGEVWNHAQLGAAIAERLADALLPATVQRVEAGETVSFGPIRVDRTGVTCRGDGLAWPHIHSLSFALNPREQGPNRQISNMVHLCVNHSWLVELGDIPNCRLFEKLVVLFQPLCQVEGRP